MNKFELKIVMEISNNWIQDGADPYSEDWKESIIEKLSELLPYANEYEFKIKVETA